MIAINKELEKKGFTVGGQKTPKFFEEWARRNCMRPVCIVRDSDGDILLADSHEPIYTLGVYRTGYAIYRGVGQIGNFNDYPIGEFAMMSRKRGIEQRVNEALAHARKTQKQLREAGFYDG